MLPRRYVGWAVSNATTELTSDANKELDLAKREQIDLDLQRKVQIDSPFIFLFQAVPQSAPRKNVNGFVSGPSFDLVLCRNVTRSQASRSVADTASGAGSAVTGRKSVPGARSRAPPTCSSISRSPSGDADRRADCRSLPARCADEPTSALDATVPMQVLAIIDSMVRELRLGLVFISHDLELVSSLCDRVLIMYAGRVMEAYRAADLAEARHPYTRQLLTASRGYDRETAAALIDYARSADSGRDLSRLLPQPRMN